MGRYVLHPPTGYSPRTSPVVSTAAAELDALLASLTRRVRETTTPELEWQLQPGVNSIGMLLAHLAISEAYWVQAIGCGFDTEDEADRVVHATLGLHMSEDGMPLPAGGAHPPSLAGKTAADYLALLTQARAATHRTLATWDDRALEESRTAGGQEVSRGWLLYHLVEHFAYHLGQIGLLASLHHRRALHDQHP